MAYPRRSVSHLAELQIVLFNRTAECATNDDSVVGQTVEQHENTDRRAASWVVDDDNGQFIFRKGDIFHEKYEIVDLLGAGGFGTVMKARDVDQDTMVALKIIKNGVHFRKSAKVEIDVLENLSRMDPTGDFLCVKMLDWFEHKEHICIAFEMLGLSLLDFMEANNYNFYPIDQVRHISYQLCYALKFLHNNGLTHTDLKPENILFLDSKFDKYFGHRRMRSSEIRIIDFGLATSDSQPHSTIVTTRYYRAPEVILQLGWEQACDVWSIGCIIFEIYLGVTLFDAEDDLEHLALMERTLGPIPAWISQRSQTDYFNLGKLDWDQNSCEGRYICDCFLPLHRYMKSDDEETRQLFDLIAQMLNYDPSRRIRLTEALRHPFFDQILDSHRAERQPKPDSVPKYRDVSATSRDCGRSG